jgi:hypothetical protein
LSYQIKSGRYNITKTFGEGENMHDLDLLSHALR